MKRIASFEIDHTILPCGIYTSRVDGDVTTYDLRMRRPNAEPVMENAAIHTIEHLFATYVRNSAWADHIIYFGPMGCRTGCYFLTRGMDGADVISLVYEAFRFIAEFNGPVPGTTAKECGNYREHDLAGARREARRYLKEMTGWTVEQLVYPQK